MSPTAAVPDVAFCRTLHAGMTGADIVSHKIAVSRFAPDLYPWPKDPDGTLGEFTPFFGEFFEAATAAAQKRLGVKKDKPGVIGAATHAALEKARNKAKTAPAFDARSIKLAQGYCVGHAERTIRERIVELALFYYAHRWQIYYSWHRPFDVIPPPHVPWLLDCSGLATICHVLAGAPNPNGNQPKGLGYTGTLMSRGERCSLGDLELGDFIFYGSSSGAGPAFNPGDPTHVAVYIGPRPELGGKHGVISNGHRPMGFYPHDYRGVNHYRHYDVGPGT